MITDMIEDLESRRQLTEKIHSHVSSLIMGSRAKTYIPLLERPVCLRGRKRPAPPTPTNDTNEELL